MYWCIFRVVDEGSRCGWIMYPLTQSMSIPSVKDAYWKRWGYCIPLASLDLLHTSEEYYHREGFIWKSLPLTCMTAMSIVSGQSMHWKKRVLGPPTSVHQEEGRSIHATQSPKIPGLTPPEAGGVTEVWVRGWRSRFTCLYMELGWCWEVSNSQIFTIVLKVPSSFSVYETYISKSEAMFLSSITVQRTKAHWIVEYVFSPHSGDIIYCWITWIY